MYYDAFGNILEKTGNVSNTILYAGYQYDEETGLYYPDARMYDPVTARLLQEDTYTGDPNDPLSLNLYTYCCNNPITYEDPNGHFLISTLIAGALIGATIGAATEVVSQKVFQKRKKLNWKAVAYGGVVGAVFGSIGAAVEGLVSDIGRQRIVDGKKLRDVNYRATIKTGGITGVTGAIGSVMKGKIGSWANKWDFKGTLGKNLVETNSSLPESAGKTNPLEMNTRFIGEKGVGNPTGSTEKSISKKVLNLKVKVFRSITLLVIRIT